MGSDPVQQGLATQAIGQRMEIILLEKKRSSESQGRLLSLRVRVLFEGKALPNAQIELSQKNQAAGIKATTDAKGEAGLTTRASGGTAILHLVHMRRCESASASASASACNDTDWESFWSSFTFSAL